MSRPYIVDTRWYRDLVESAPDATILIDAEGCILLVNAQAERLFGYAREELLGTEVETLIPERFRGAHRIHRDGYFSEPKVRAMGTGIELWGRRKDGSEFPIEISLSPLRTEAGVLTTASIRDGSERQRANDKFRALLESAPDAMVIIDDRGIMRLVNAQAKRMFGYQRGSMIGRPVEMLIPERLREQHKRHRGTYFEAPKVRGMGAGLQLWGRRKDGTEFPIEISLSPLVTEDGVWATAAVRDITQRRKAEQRFRALLDNAPDAMVMIGRGGQIVMVNAQAERLFGYPRDALVGQLVEMLIPERLRSRHREHRQSYFNDPRVRPMGVGLELSGLRASGEEFAIEISLAPMSGDDEILATATVRDISERQAVERKLARYAEDLARSNRDLEQFAYVASHDLQAPLRNVVGFSQLLRKRMTGKLEATEQEFLDFIESSARHMQALVNGLLAYSRVGGADVAFSDVDCERVLDGVLDQLHTVIAERGAQIERGPLPTLRAAEREIHQLLQNLIGNGLKFQPGSGPHVAIDATREDGFWHFRVRDRGIGISEEHREKIFQIFQRLHASDEYEGTGIGLAICQKIVQHHGGKIWLESVPGQGSVFHFTLAAE